MRKKLIFICLAGLVLLGACKKDSGNKSENFGTAKNTWTFTEGSQVFNGYLVLENATLNTLLQGNDTYTFGVLGYEKSSGYFFNIVLSLEDLDFTVKTYQSGLNTDHIDGFYYFADLASDDIYKSSNYDPGPIMNFQITHYDAAKDIVTISFSGQAYDANSNLVNITNGEITCSIERI